MKYNININQKVLADTTLDLTDCAILDWLITICNSKSEAINNKRVDGMTWVDYGTLLKDMPLLRIKDTSALTKRFKKLEMEGFVKRNVIREGSITKMYVSLQDKIDLLFFSKKNGLININPPTDINQSMSTDLNHPISILGSNHYTSDTIRRSPEEMKLVQNTFNQFWTAYPKKESKPKVKEKWFKKDFYKQIDKILGFIEEAKKTDRWKKGMVKNPVTFLNQESWLDDLAGYYDRSSSPKGVYKDDKSTDYNKRVRTLQN